MRLLVVEDERALCETIVRSLRRLAYSVDSCWDGDRALELLCTERYDLVVLDLNLPGQDGMTVLRTLRKGDRETRVLILSARSEVSQKVEGLDAGANDYLSKPFHLAELEARIRSLTLRQFTQQDVLLSCGPLTFDTKARTALAHGQTLTLTRKETGILEYLMLHQGRPVSQEELIPQQGVRRRVSGSVTGVGNCGPSRRHCGWRKAPPREAPLRCSFLATSQPPLLDERTLSRVPVKKLRQALEIPRPGTGSGDRGLTLWGMPAERGGQLFL